MKKASSSPILLDVNVLLALAWPNHAFHSSASRRLEGYRGRWATCALTELGFIRISSNPALIRVAKTPAEAARLLSAMVADPRHVYLEGLPSPTSESFVTGFDAILGSKQVTDSYLVSLARLHRATLMTFDTRLRALALSETETEILTS